MTWLKKSLRLHPSFFSQRTRHRGSFFPLLIHCTCCSGSEKLNRHETSLWYDTFLLLSSTNRVTMVPLHQQVSEFKKLYCEELLATMSFFVISLHRSVKASCYIFSSDVSCVASSINSLQLHHFGKSELTCYCFGYQLTQHEESTLSLDLPPLYCISVLFVCLFACFFYASSHYKSTIQKIHLLAWVSCNISTFC